MSNYKDRTGEVGVSNEGYNMKIISYRSHSDMDVELDDGTIINSVISCNFDKGQIRNPNHRSVYRVGYLSVGKYKPTKLIDGKKTDTFHYRSWKEMLKRCYSNKYQSRYPSYIGCTVCEEWHNFQSFAKWTDENYYVVDGSTMMLDKDILLKGNKVYSPEFCVYSPNRINTLFVNRRRCRGEFPIGVSFAKSGSKYVARCQNSLIEENVRLGGYTTPEQAFQVYKNYKENHIKEIADYYKDKIPQKLYEAMYNWAIEITD